MAARGRGTRRAGGAAARARGGRGRARAGAAARRGGDRRPRRGPVAAFLLWPLLTSALDRGVRAGDLAAALLAHVACAGAGATLGHLGSPPATARAATSLVLILSATTLTVALTARAGPLAGPGAVAAALAEARPGKVTAALVLAAGGCAGWGVCCELLARRAATRR